MLFSLTTCLSYREGQCQEQVKKILMNTGPEERGGCGGAMNGRLGRVSGTGSLTLTISLNVIVHGLGGGVRSYT